MPGSWWLSIPCRSTAHTYEQMPNNHWLLYWTRMALRRPGPSHTVEAAWLKQQPCCRAASDADELHQPRLLRLPPHPPFNGAP